MSFPDAFRVDPSSAGKVVPGWKALLKGGSDLDTSHDLQCSVYVSLSFPDEILEVGRGPFIFVTACL